MADERVVPEDLKALYNAAEVARDYADSRAQANQVLGLIERIADLQAKLEESKPLGHLCNEIVRLHAELQRLRDENERLHEIEAVLAGRDAQLGTADKWNGELRMENAHLKRLLDEICIGIRLNRDSREETLKLASRSQEAQKREDNNG